VSTIPEATIRRLCLLSAAATGAQRSLRFPSPDDAIEAANAPDGGPPVVPVPFDAAVRGPERRCAETARLLGLAAEPREPLRAWDPGTWSGQRVEDVADDDAAGFAAWRTDPTWAPPGGEALTTVVARVARWMDEALDGRLVAVVDASVVRAAVVHALDLDPATAWRIDVEPLAAVVLERGATAWRLVLAPAASGRRRSSPTDDVSRTGAAGGTRP
jgi:broad specificity phosphatase PhoE